MAVMRPAGLPFGLSADFSALPDILPDPRSHPILYTSSLTESGAQLKCSFYGKRIESSLKNCHPGIRMGARKSLRGEEEGERSKS